MFLLRVHGDRPCIIFRGANIDRKNSELITRDEVACRWCAEPILREAKVCKWAVRRQALQRDTHTSRMTLGGLSRTTSAKRFVER